MSLTIILTAGIVLSVIFHFIGVYANAKKTVWVMLVLMWAASINVAMSEVSPKGYEYIKGIKGKYEATDRLIQEAEPEISLYEMLKIRKSFDEEKKKQ